MISVIRGNRKTLKWGLKVDGEYLDTLASATKITFAVKEDKEDQNVDASIFIEWINGGDPEPRIILDSPEEGWVRVTLYPSDTSIGSGKYFYALQVEWADENKLEFIYGDGLLQVKSDVIR